MNDRLERLAPLTGVALVVLTVAGFAVASSPEIITDSRQEIAAWFDDDTSQVFIGSWLDMLGTLLLLWFVAVLRSWLVGREGGTGRLGNLAFGATVAAAACFLVYDSTMIALAGRADEDGQVLNAAAAATAFDVAGITAYVGGAMAFGTALAAIAVASFRHAAMPVWLGASAAILAAVCIFPLTTWLGLIVSNLWILGASVWLFRVMAPAARAATPPATPARA